MSLPQALIHPMMLRCYVRESVQVLIIHVKKKIIKTINYFVLNCVI